MRKFRTRLLFALITLIFAVLIGLGLLLGQLYKSYYLKSFDERLIKESEMIASYVEEEGGIQSLNNESIKRFSSILDARVTITNVAGVIIYDNNQIMEIVNDKHQETIKELIKRDSTNHQLVGEKGHDLHYYWRPIEYLDHSEGFVVLSTRMTEINKAYKQIWWILTISLGFAFFVILLLGIKIADRYTKPIESATKAAYELAKGNYRARTYEDQMDETGMLSASINVLARNLQEMKKMQEMQQDRLSALIENMGSGLILIDRKGYIHIINRSFKEFFQVSASEYINKLYYDVIDNKEIIRLVEELFMTEQKIKKQLNIPVGDGRKHFEIYGVPIIGTNDVWRGILLVFHDITDLKKLEQMRKDFVANVSHELKTPITSIKGFSETLLDGAMEDKQALEAFLHIILQESDRLQILIHDLLELSKIEQIGFHLNIQEHDLTTTMQEVVAILSNKAAEKNIELTLEMTSDTNVIEGDADRLKQIFLNLVSNAITYTPNEGKVLLLMNESQSTITVEVIDTGIGIEKEEISRIFERFYRVDKARSRNSGGTGLGLAIVKHLVEAHKGKVIVASEQGKGTKFVVELNKKFNRKR
ncbi:two-component system phosphate regulon sensor histidine kinase PhoR [Cytobacillus eiseniae]|uniref:histidine kinase n=1 Tax=Cytobacillus eiseniae TaxID=762947 RepID=A0ABS4RJM0_9BACI|nr:ATP-binding protein [Cytobacillus eiseniae]MBP2243100.1 two-component system phosphate regulon sensor histidine kinase PhoR [Cytobacillus eiseniae]